MHGVSVTSITVTSATTWWPAHSEVIFHALCCLCRGFSPKIGIGTFGAQKLSIHEALAVSSLGHHQLSPTPVEITKQQLGSGFSPRLTWPPFSSAGGADCTGSSTPKITIKHDSWMVLDSKSVGLSECIWLVVSTPSGYRNAKWLKQQPCHIVGSSWSNRAITVVSYLL